MPTTITHTLRASGGDYTTMSAWEAAQQRDLVALDEIAVLECYNDWAGGLVEVSVEVNGWTSSDTNYIKIHTPPSERTNGTPGTGFQTKISADNGAYIFSGRVRVEGIEFSTNLYTTSTLVSLDPEGGEAHLSSCLIIDPNNSTDTGVSLGDWANSPVIAKNCIAYGGFNHAFLMGAFSTQMIANCVAVSAINGFSGVVGSDSVARNCVAYNCTTSFGPYYGGVSSNNAASDGATTTPPGASPVTTDIVAGDFVDAANNDFHLSAISQLIGAGADLSGTFTTDIDGDVRVAPWDIGADQYVTASPGPIIASALRGA